MPYAIDRNADDYGGAGMDVYATSHAIAGYMPDDDTPHVFVGDANDAARAHADDIAEVVTSLLDAAYDDADDAYVVVDGVGVYANVGDDVRRYDDVGDVHDADSGVDVADVYADVARVFDDIGVAENIATCGGAYGTYVESPMSPTYYYDVARLDDDAYAAIVEGVHDAAASGTYDDYADVVDDVRDAAYDALHDAHIRADDYAACDICAAASHGFFDAAAVLYVGATEVPAIVARHMYAVDASQAIGEWWKVSHKVSAACTSCGAYVYLDAAYHDVHDVDDDAAAAYADMPTRCPNCLGDDVHVPAHVYAVTTTRDYSRSVEYVRVRADVGADTVGEAYAERIADRCDAVAQVDNDERYISSEVEHMPDADDVRRGYDVHAAAYYVATTYDVHDDDDYDDDTYADIIDVHVRRVATTPPSGADTWNAYLDDDDAAAASRYDADVSRVYDVPAYDVYADISHATYDAPTTPTYRTSAHVPVIVGTYAVGTYATSYVREFQATASRWHAYAVGTVRRDDYGVVVYDVVRTTVE